MSNTIISVENISKQYRLGMVGSKTLNHDFNRWWHKIRGKEDPYLKIGESNDRTKVGNSDYVWALQDINFEVKQGEVLGIIGRNGAGKSTLLKILSKVTQPTTGQIKVKGRIASLLEVGTGFHPELSGRENIYLNGAILGMTKKEISSKFDEIVDFAGVERYIDTPVKRYSSGMYVRLAFGVAAHLEPEILIVDEVLAVGDAEFQKKCLGKMKDVSVNDGRTVLFVSHNMSAMNTLCNRGLYLKDGLVNFYGEIEDAIKNYLTSGSDLYTKKVWDEKNRLGDDVVEIHSAKLTNKDSEELDAIDFHLGAFIEIEYTIKKTGYKPIINLHFFNQKGDVIMVVAEPETEQIGKVGLYKTIVNISGHLLNQDRYIVGLASSTMLPQRIHCYDKEALIFDVVEDMNLRDNEYRGPMPGVIRPNFAWESIKLN